MRRKNATTEFLKECMADALLRLLKEKPIDQITILEITDLADVGRVTFYRHFNSKEELLYFKFQLILNKWYNTLSPKQIDDPAVFIEPFFEMMGSIRDILTTLYQANLQHIILLALSHSLNEHTPPKGEDDAYFAAFWICGLFGVLMEWVGTDYKKTPKELTQLTLKNFHS